MFVQSRIFHIFHAQPTPQALQVSIDKKSAFISIDLSISNLIIPHLLVQVKLCVLSRHLL